MLKLPHLAAAFALCGWATIGLAQQDDLFDSLDKNGDGVLTADEIPEEQRRFFERLLRAGDKNEDGKLSKAEYMATLEADERPAGQPGGRPGAGRPGFGGFDPAALFERMDRNKDGKLTRDELPEQGREQMIRLFERLGKDEITLEEYREGLGQMMREGMQGRGRPESGRPPEGQFTFELFTRLDTNNDGKLSRNEVPEPLQDRLAPLFERLGTDALTLEQFARSAEMQRGSFGERGRPGAEQLQAQRGRRPEMERDGEPAPERGERRPAAGRPGMDRPDGRPGAERPDGRPGMERPEGGPPFGRGGFGQMAFIRVLDLDGDGRISKEEALHIARLFEELDRNGDGLLDAAELMGFPGRPGEGPGGPGPFGFPGGDRPRGERPEGDRPQMERPEEGRPGFRRPEAGRPDGPRPDGPRPDGEGPDGEGPRFSIDAMFERLDTNKDGFISKEEAPERMQANFDQFDTNNDGKLSREELANIFSRGTEGRRPDGARPEGERPGRGRRPGSPEGDRPGRPQRPPQE